MTWWWWPVLFVILELGFLGLAITGMLLVNKGLGILAIVGFFCMFLVVIVDIYLFHHNGLDAVTCMKKEEPVAPAPGKPQFASARYQQRPVPSVAAVYV
jgi:hypothetical protein